MLKYSRYVIVASLLGLTLAACDTGVGTGAASGNTRIVFKAATLPSATAIPDSGMTIQWDGDVRWSHDVIPLDAVSSIKVTLAAIQVLQTQQDTTAQDSTGSLGWGGDHWGGFHSRWVTVDVPVGTSVDLMNLPTDGMTVANANLPAGTYGQIRMLFTQATITLSRDVTLPDSTVISAGTYPLQIGRASSWLYVQVNPFTVTQDQADVVVTFDPAASVRAIIVLSDGTLVMPPVVRASCDRGEASDSTQTGGSGG
jgi:hypothetical protein